MQTRLVVADGHPMVQEAIGLALESRWPTFAVDKVGSIAALKALALQAHLYRLMVLDLLLPDAQGFSGLLMAKQYFAQTPVVMLSSRSDQQTVASARNLGASGFVSKSAPTLEMIHIFERVFAGENTFSDVILKPEQASKEEMARRIATLSASQTKVLICLADGKLNKQIATEMAITEATVKAHLTAIFRKLGVNNRTQAILAAQPLVQLKR